MAPSDKRIAHKPESRLGNPVTAGLVHVRPASSDHEADIHRAGRKSRKKETARSTASGTSADCKT